MNTIKTFGIVTLGAASAGASLRQFENGNYTTAGFVAFGVVAALVMGVIALRNRADRKALNN
jgi:uncharacterized membrane protein